CRRSRRGGRGGRGRGAGRWGGPGSGARAPPRARAAPRPGSPRPPRRGRSRPALDAMCRVAPCCVPFSRVKAKTLSFTSYPIASPLGPASMTDPATFELEARGVRIAGEGAGEGPPIVLLHGLTATRRYVVMGSRFLERAGYRLISYDARGHGESSPAPDPSAYEYADMVADLEAVLEHAGVERAVLAGSSMGAATA